MTHKKGIVVGGLFFVALLGVIVYCLVVFSNNKTPKPLDITQDSTTNNSVTNTDLEFVGFLELTTKGLPEDSLIVLKKQISTYVKNNNIITLRVKLDKDSINFVSANVMQFSITMDNNHYSAVATIDAGVISMQLYDDENNMIYDNRSLND